MNIKTLSTLMLIVPLTSLASTIAVIDSGTDYKHEMLNGKIWNNPNEVADDGVDHDHNGKVNDFYGWNFADKNHFVIDYKYQGTFSQDPYKYFEIQLKRFNGVATEEEMAWARAKIADPNFIAEIEKFGNYVHGTHVAGISAKDADAAKIMALKIIPTEVKQPGKDLAEELSHQVDIAKPGVDLNQLKDMLIKQLLTKLADAQGKNLEAVGIYARLQDAKVANCSFGTSAAAVGPLFEKLLPIILRRPLTDDELKNYTKFFMGKVVEDGRQFMIYGKTTFFVIAAGNDGSNNDEMPTFPANIKRDNSIAVAATQGRHKLATFSNYGETNVEGAAPGVVILSSIPGNEYLRVSGTSQATPYVTNTVGRMFDANTGLSFKDMKTLLIGTVDKKDFLTGKVTSGGIVNPDRAIYAAKLALNRSLTDAIDTARKEIADLGEDPSTKLHENEGIFLPLPNMIR